MSCLERRKISDCAGPGHPSPQCRHLYHGLGKRGVPEALFLANIEASPVDGGHCIQALRVRCGWDEGGL